MRGFVFARTFLENAKTQKLLLLAVRFFVFKKKGGCPPRIPLESKGKPRFVQVGQNRFRSPQDKFVPGAGTPGGSVRQECMFCRRRKWPGHGKKSREN